MLPYVSLFKWDYFGLYLYTLERRPFCYYLIIIYCKAVIMPPYKYHSVHFKYKHIIRSAFFKGKLRTHYIKAENC